MGSDIRGMRHLCKSTVDLFPVVVKYSHSNISSRPVNRVAAEFSMACNVLVVAKPVPNTIHVISSSKAFYSVTLYNNNCLEGVRDEISPSDNTAVEPSSWGIPGENSINNTISKFCIYRSSRC